MDKRELGVGQKIDELEVQCSTDKARIKEKELKIGGIDFRSQRDAICIGMEYAVEKPRFFEKIKAFLDKG